MIDFSLPLATTFIGDLFIPQNTYSAFNNYVPTAAVEGYLHMFGSEAFNNFDETAPRWSRLLVTQYTPVYTYDIYNIVTYYIYYRYVRDGFMMTDTGAVINKNENSTAVNQMKISADRYNKYINRLLQLYAFMQATPVVEETVSITFGGTYSTFTVEPGSLLSIGETVYLNGEAVTVFDYDGTTITVEGDYSEYTEYCYDAYWDVVYGCTDKIMIW